MTLEYQSDLIKYLLQFKEARKFIEWLEPEVFDLDEQSTVFSLLKNFVTQYKQTPSLGNLLQHFDNKCNASKTPITKDVKSIIETCLRESFEPYEGSTSHIRAELLQEYQKKSVQKIFLDNASKMKAGNPESLDVLFTQMDKAKRITQLDGDEENNRGQFLLAEHKVGEYSVVTGSPTYLHQLNRMTSAKGFYSPQLVIFMGPPKSFKTGTLLSVAVGYVRDGFKVYYADCENSQDRIRDRAKQCMLEATFEEFTSGEMDEVLAEMVGRYKHMGGDFRADFYPAHTKTMLDIEIELDYLKEEYDWVPDIICYDYLDLFKPEDRTIKEKRLQIQAVYFDAIRLQKRRNIMGFSVSQVNKDAVNKAVIDMTNFSEDFGKAANVHAAFALCRTEDEKKAGVMRIIPVVQRDGVAQHSGEACFVSVDESRMSVKEITYDEWKEAVEIARVDREIDNPPRKKRGSGSARGQIPVTDD